MSTLTEVLKLFKTKAGQPALVTIAEAAQASGMAEDAVKVEALESNEIEYFPELGYVIYAPTAPARLTREERKVSKSDQPWRHFSTET